MKKSATRQSSTRVTLNSGSPEPLDKSKKSTSEKKTQRALTPQLSAAHHDYSFYDASVTLYDDIDGDGFYSRFQVEFDADTLFDWAEVYAKLYVSQDGGPWELYYTTEVFDIHGQNNDDDYRVMTTLNIDFPSDSYDILVDLYEYGHAGIVATMGPEEDVDLFDLPLEDRTQENSYNSGFRIYNVQTDLLRDEDGDGYYSEFAIALDIDTDYSVADVYAEIYFLNERNEWELEYTTQEIELQGITTLDTVHLEFEWASGYQPRYYDFKVVVRDAHSQERLVESSSEFAALNRIPLESADYEDAVDPIDNPGGRSGGSSSSQGSGGGSLHWLFLTALLSARLRTRQ